MATDPSKDQQSRNRFADPPTFSNSLPGIPPLPPANAHPGGTTASYNPPMSQSATPTVTLYDPVTVRFATLLGGPLAGSLVLAVNYKRLGKASLGILTFVLGIVFMALLIKLDINIPQGATIGVALALAFGAQALAVCLQGSNIDAHIQAGGKVGSRWFGAALGLAGLVLTLALIFSTAFMGALMGSTRLAVGVNGEILYSGKATASEASALGEALKKDGIFQTSVQQTVIFSKKPEGTILAFGMKDGMWDDPQMVSGIEQIGRDAAPAIGGLPITLRMLNSAGVVKKEWVIQ